MSLNDLKIEVFDAEKMAETLKYYPYYVHGFVAVGEKKWWLPHVYLTNGEKIRNFEPRPDDTWVITYPRSGTTLMQELVWLVANDMNFDEAHRRHLLDRFPFLEPVAILNKAAIAGKTNDEKLAVENSVEYVQKKPSPRFIKSHLPFDLLPKIENSDCKIIYVARNPRDVVVSWYYFQKEIDVISYKGNFKQFCDIFLNDHTIYSPYWEHVKEAWAKRHRPNTLFIFYEDLMKDMSGSIRKIAAFYGKSYSDEQIAKLADHLNINKFRKNKMVNVPSGGENMKTNIFIRQGIVGGWRKHFTAEIEAKFNEWIANNTKDTDLVFPS